MSNRRGKSRLMYMAPVISNGVYDKNCLVYESEPDIYIRFLTKTIQQFTDL